MVVVDRRRVRRRHDVHGRGGRIADGDVVHGVLRESARAGERERKVGRAVDRREGRGDVRGRAVLPRLIAVVDRDRVGRVEKAKALVHAVGPELHALHREDRVCLAVREYADRGLVHGRRVVVRLRRAGRLAGGKHRRPEGAQKRKAEDRREDFFHVRDLLSRYASILSRSGTVRNAFFPICNVQKHIASYPAFVLYFSRKKTYNTKAFPGLCAR